MRTRAEVVGVALGGGTQVGTGGQPHEPDRETVLVAQADLDAVVVDDDRDVLTWDGLHGVSSSGLVEQFSDPVRRPGGAIGLHVAIGDLAAGLLRYRLGYLLRWGVVVV